MVLCVTVNDQETFLPGDPENSFSWGYFVALKGEPSSVIVTGMVSANFDFSKRAEGNLSLKKEGRSVLSFSKSLECERIEEKVHETGTFTRCASVRLSRVTFDFSMSSKVCGINYTAIFLFSVLCFFFFFETGMQERKGGLDRLKCKVRPLWRFNSGCGQARKIRISLYIRSDPLKQ